ncbi:CCA tRNA nucleotidyltransferase [Candidatus Latescibacterota bacterium]
MDDTIRHHAMDIINRLRKAGFRAFIVGGAVRDMVMGLEPKDYDIATDASQKDVERLFDKVSPVGAQFGVSLVFLDGKPYEVAQFRMDGEYIDGRRPLGIEPATELEDIKRRDFTINAMMYDPVEDRIIDLIGGENDITDRVIRTVGDPDIRFAEDRLRMLRAVRFAAQFNFIIKTDTMNSLKYHANHITDVSNERIGDELSKMFTCPHPDLALTLLDETGLLEVVLPEIAALKGIEQPPDYHPEGDVFEHTRYMLGLFGGGSPTLAFAVLLHDVGKPVTITKTDRLRFHRHEEAGAAIAVRILKHLRFSRDTIARVEALVRNHMRFMHVKQMRRSTLKRFIAMDGFDELLELFRLDCLASHGSLDLYEFVKDELQLQLKHEESLSLPNPLINGHDLIALGYKPGPLFKKIFSDVMDAQLDGRLAAKEEALKFVQRNFPLALEEYL